jgi:hypothetical protein
MLPAAKCGKVSAPSSQIKTDVILSGAKNLPIGRSFGKLRTTMVLIFEEGGTR